MTTADTKTRSPQSETSPSFDLSSVTIPSGEIRAGGVPKDGIPALSNPQTIEPSDASYLEPEDRVVGLLLGKQARAYPLKILTYHEVVNDRCGNIPVAVTYCPLCDSVVAFDRRTELGEREFGVSGYLYNSNVLMYDRGGRPESLWSQLMAQGVSGPAGGRPLKTLPVELTTWQDWLDGHNFTLRYHSDAESLRVVEAEEGLQWMYCFWFAWYAFHRLTKAFQVSG